MILKTLDYKDSRHNAGVYEEWNFFDNIVNASTFFHEETKMTVVRCTFRDGNTITFAVPYVAYLMSDTGKTIEKIMAADVEELGDTANAVYNTLQEAVNGAMKDDS